MQNGIVRCRAASLSAIAKEAGRAWRNAAMSALIIACSLIAGCASMSNNAKITIWCNPLLHAGTWAATVVTYGLALDSVTYVGQECVNAISDKVSEAESHAQMGKMTESARRGADGDRASPVSAPAQEATDASVGSR